MRTLRQPDNPDPGVRKPSPSDMVICPECEGMGSIPVPTTFGFGRIDDPCPVCDATGWVYI